MDTEAFIADIQVRPAIWKSSHPQRKFKNVVRIKWDEMRKLYPNWDVDHLKKKWKNLRDTYIKELKKVRKLQSESGNAGWYEPSWQYYRYLEFLKDEYIPPSQKAEDPLTLEIEIKEETVETDDTTVEKVHVIKEEMDVSDNDIASCASSPSDTPTRTISPEPSTSKHHDSNKKQTVTDIRAEYLEIERRKLKILEDEVSKQNKTNKNEERSSDYHFLMSILPEMEKLSPMQKMRLRNRINEALLEEISVTMYVQPQPMTKNE